MGKRTVEILEIGEIRLGREIGKRETDSYIWSACIVCGAERWVRFIKGNPVSVRCSKHKDSKQGFAEDNSNWSADTSNQGTGGDRARRWYPEQPCEVCGKVAERHHRDGNTLNNEQSNVVFRCRKHHMEIDGRLSRLIERNKGRNN